MNGFNETRKRFKRFIPYSTELWISHLQELFRYACYNGDLLSCGVTLARILPYRFYINMNYIFDKIKGKAGPSEYQRMRLTLIVKKINLIQTQIRNHRQLKHMEEAYSKNKKHTLQLQLLHIYNSLCRFYGKQDSDFIGTRETF